jgi:hypothetical protein
VSVSYFGIELSEMTFWVSLLLIFRLLLLDSTVVIDKHESAIVLWIRISLGALVSGTEVALEK